MVPVKFLAKSGPLIRSTNLRFISTFFPLRQESQLPEPPPPRAPPPSFPALGSWGSNFSSTSPSVSAAQIPISLGFLRTNSRAEMQILSQTLDTKDLMDQFAKWMTSQRWADVKELFELWVKALDSSGKPNKPDVDIYNQYLHANLLIGASVSEMLNLVAQMDDYGLLPNTASFNLVLKAMLQVGTSQAAETLIQRMLQIGKEYEKSLPDGESYDLIIALLLSTNQIDAALKYIDLTLASGYKLSTNAFIGCIQRCVNNGRLDTLVTILERCQKMDQNKSLCPPWHVCNYIAHVAMRADNNDLAYCALMFFANWIARGEIGDPAVLLSVNEGLVVSALGTAGRTFDSTLLEGSWAILKRSLRQKMVPSPASYLAKIHAYANMGNLKHAFSTLQELEVVHGNNSQEDGEGLFSPFYSLSPLVVACSRNGFKTLDMVYHQLEILSREDPPYKSIAALNCVILGCANIWDLDRAYQTFNAISATFGLTPNLHSYNALLFAFGKLGKRDDAVKVFEHFAGLGVKPNMTTYSLLIDAHLSVRDPKSALAVIDDMIHAGHEPSKEMLKKIRRRCVREMDYSSDDKVETLAKQFKIRMGTEVRRDLLFSFQYSTDYS
ncbi:Pentatricopeptide repeat-containing protein -mitochondrial [Striga hermonthica]|uniref:Pentatricopeptide repeat-containing protein -mitochondrial n=1 Tax=Striga hermonthica TaxID=68872 RepID=A0A9N7NE61_STRHE|nr:Pentatricopeptide repeat-containing protein -mitochondrial [Striga hermonthica]